MTELTVIAPILNERDNIRPLTAALAQALGGIDWEIIFVDDDSPDGSALVVRDLADHDRRVRIIQRIGRRGLASACVEGVLASSAPYFAVIDCDLQHDERILPAMLQRLESEGLDVVIASRFAVGGSVGEWSRLRRFASWLGSRLSRLILRADLSDPMSGFFVMRRQAFDEIVHNLSQFGFKILLDLFVTARRPLRFAEVPYRFRDRQHGRSKLGGAEIWEFGVLIADKLVGRILPIRFVLFVFVGGTGVIVHLLVLRAALTANIEFRTAQIVALFAAMTTNFILNNTITYRDLRLRGLAFFRGLMSFYLVCALGAVANFGVATLIYRETYAWWIAGLAGAVIGAIWNYAASSFITWRRHPYL
ncbi:MAG TPA: glycosyltransferase family 2 protein [Xanthobacteraceae bacterium]|nr:glycosyltransferase family 2 protein [Xanthobacteraceae bacterium]